MWIEAVGEVLELPTTGVAVGGTTNLPRDVSDAVIIDPSISNQCNRLD